MTWGGKPERFDRYHSREAAERAMRHVQAWPCQAELLRRERRVGPWVPVEPAAEPRCVCSRNYPGPSKHSSMCPAGLSQKGDGR